MKSHVLHSFKPIAVPILYILTASLLIGLWSAIPLSCAYAYVDPSVMTYTIQAVAGLAVALSAVIGVVFRRTRKKIYQIFNIDENAHKLTENDICPIDPKSSEAEKQYQHARDNAIHLAEENQRVAARNDKREMPWKLRLSFSFVMSLFAAFIIFIAPALEIVGSNTDSLVFGLSNIGWIPVVFCLLFALITALLLSLLRGLPFYVALLLIFCLTVGAYVQSLFLNSGMMPTDGGFINWGDKYFTDKMWMSGIIWLLIIVVPLLLSAKHHHIWLKATTVAACLIMIVQLVGVGSVLLKSSETASTTAEKPYVTQGGLLSLAPERNVVLFVLDTYDTALLNQILEEDPAFLQDFTGFTYFPNSTGTMIPTANAIPNLLTGKKPAPNQDISDYRQNRYKTSTFIPDVHACGYDIGIYTDSLMMDFNNPEERKIAQDTLNIHPVNRAPIDVWQTFLVTMQCALYREAPWIAKPWFWYYTSDLNNRMIAEGDGNLNDTLYELDDAAILKLFRDKGLTISETDAAGSFRFIHLFGPHFPFSIDEKGQSVGTNQSTQLAQAKGSMQVVKEYIHQLKELGLYDNTTLIVTADHGVWDLTQDPLQWAVSPIMLAKPSYSADDPNAAAPLTISATPVSHDDIQATVLAAMNGDESNYGTSLFEQNDPNRIRYFDALTNAGGNEQRFVEYAIKGNALNLDNWEKTGIEWVDD